MSDDPFEQWKKTFLQLGQFNAQLLTQGMGIYAKGMEQLLKSMSGNMYLVERAVEDGLIPSVRAFFEMERDITGPLLQGLSGEREVDDVVKELGQRMRAGGRYGQLVDSLAAG